MRVALASDDGRNISAHFGRAEYYVVAEIRDGAVLSRRLLPKENHNSLRTTELAHRKAHGESPEKVIEGQHRKMFAPVEDCDILVARGMGAKAMRRLQELGLKLILTDLATVDEALRAYVQGTLQHHPERIH